MPLSDFIPEPAIVLYGCRPHVPYPLAGNGQFHAPASAEAGDRVFPRERCPTCKGAIGLPRRVRTDGIDALDPRDERTYCETCGSMSPRNERAALSGRIGFEGPSKSEIAELEAKHELKRRHGGVILSERQRRHIWRGAKGDGISTQSEVTNRAKVGRAWLTAIGQEPDFALILDKKGRVVGRLDAPADPELDAA